MRGGLEREREGEGLYRYVPAAVVCNIMITLPACAPGAVSLLHPLFLSPSLPLSPCPSPFHPLSFSRFPSTRTPGAHPLSAAMLPGNMIIVIICTLLRSYPPDSSPLHNSPVILYRCGCCLRSLSPHSPHFLSSSRTSLAPPHSCHSA